MGDRRKRFTEQMIERLRPPASGRLELKDALTPALILRVTDRGRKTFSALYKVAGEGGLSASGHPRTGTQHRMTLGRWPTLRLAAARERAAEIVAAAGEGRDPRTERTETFRSRQASTFAAVVPQFLEDEKRTIASWRNAEMALRKHVLPRWGERPMGDIALLDLHELLDEIRDAGRIGSAREVRKQLSKLFRWAENREIVDRNPVARLRRDDLRPNRDAGRALKDDELRAAWKAAAGLGYPFGPLYQLLMLTGQRRGEWANARWSEIDEEGRLLTVPVERHKSRRGHIIPIPEPAWAVVQALPRWTRGDHLFSTRSSGRTPVSGFNRAAGRLLRDAGELYREATGEGLQPFRVHDLRVTCKTRMAELRIDFDVREAVLGHAKPDLVARYDKHDYLEEKRAALEQYAGHVMEEVGE